MSKINHKRVTETNDINAAFFNEVSQFWSAVAGGYLANDANQFEHITVELQKRGVPFEKK